MKSPTRAPRKIQERALKAPESSSSEPEPTSREHVGKAHQGEVKGNGKVCDRAPQHEAPSQSRVPSPREAASVGKPKEAASDPSRELP